MTPADITALRASHSPQPTQGRVLHGLHVAKEGNVWRIWDSRQTVGYLCSTDSPEVLLELLTMESQSQGAVRTLITGEPSPYNYAPPRPSQATYRGPARIDPSRIKV